MSSRGDASELLFIAKEFLRHFFRQKMHKIFRFRMVLSEFSCALIFFGLPSRVALFLFLMLSPCQDNREHDKRSDTFFYFVFNVPSKFVSSF